MTNGRLAPVINSAIAIASTVSAQTQATDPDTTRLRTLFFQRDVETGAIEGRKLAAGARATTELKAWLVLNDDNPADVPPWMKQKNYTFAVLLDDGYVAQKAKVTAFPTTWFLDREGKRAFVKEGWSEKLVEEFTWRIEAIRAGTGGGSR